MYYQHTDIIRQLLSHKVGFFYSQPPSSAHEDTALLAKVIQKNNDPSKSYEKKAAQIYLLLYIRIRILDMKYIQIAFHPSATCNILICSFTFYFNNRGVSQARLRGWFPGKPEQLISLKQQAQMFPVLNRAACCDIHVSRI